jgi:hypothetical protein
LRCCRRSSRASPAAAQAYPSRPVKIIVPFSPGTAADIVARLLGQRLAEMWGPGVVIENQAGAGGNIGAGNVAKAAPDGYTLVMFGINHVINPSLYREVSYDALRDFKPIARIAVAPLAIVANPGFAPNSIPELVALAKQQRQHPVPLRRQRERDASRVRAAEVEDGRSHDPRAVQEHRADADGHHRQPDCAGRTRGGKCVAALQGGHVEGAGDNDRKALVDPARRSYRGRGRHCGLRRGGLERPARAGAHARRGDRQDQCSTIWCSNVWPSARSRGRT